MVGPTTKSHTCEAIIVFFIDSSLYCYLYSCAIPIIAICWEYNLILIGVMLTICLVTNIIMCVCVCVCVTAYMHVAKMRVPNLMDEVSK